MLFAQIGLIGYTAYLAPKKSRPKLLQYFIYTTVVFFLWFVYACLAMLLNDALGVDVPGAGYLFIGFVAWCVGTLVFGIKARRKPN